MNNQNTQLSAAIVQHIRDVEAAMNHAENSIDERLSIEWNEAFERVFRKNDWYYSDGTPWDGWFCPQRWTSEGGRKRRTEAWFDIVTLGGDDYHSWLANFVAGPPHAALQFSTSGSKSKLLPIYDGEKSAIDRLRGLNFIQEGTTFHLLMQIDAEELAQGFEQNDLSAAIRVFDETAMLLEQAMPSFDALHLAMTEGDD
jgi:hypothetical protein|tara:strand:- start:321 stop:917 length:597 start_codon:yes stop_codon:yes gene_type:complete